LVWDVVLLGALSKKGNRRESSRPGYIQLSTNNPESVIFPRLVELEKAKQFDELITECERLIAESPEWLTPYLYLGVAYANTGRKESAIGQFEYIVKNAVGDPSYSEASEFLKKLRN
jgi:tetratricopeptide (TPR) repeat protein